MRIKENLIMLSSQEHDYLYFCIFPSSDLILYDEHFLIDHSVIENRRSYYCITKATAIQ